MAWVTPVILEGPRVRLRPLSLVDAANLHAVCAPDTFDFFVSVQPRGTTLHDFQEYVRERLELPNSLSFVVERKTTGEILGETALMDIREGARGLEIGMTWYARDARGTAVNPECKFLLLRHVFEELGAIRVTLKTDARNLHSQGAIRKLGGVFEGTLRHHGIQPNGHIRDTTYFSVLASEWPVVKSGLLDRLKD